MGILMAHSQHGYQINEFIEMNLSRVTDMKKSTAYATLDRLAVQGLVEVHSEQAGNRPVRKVYSITAQGMQYFRNLLKDNLMSGDKMQFTGDIGLMFIDHLSKEDAVHFLEERRESLSREIARHEQAPPHGFGLGVDLAMDHHLAHLKLDHEWLTQVINDLRYNSPDDAASAVPNHDLTSKGVSH
nr:PadR family transcriptional regulator [Sulfobacillus harzensis]